jgi:hypothetical protein
MLIGGGLLPPFTEPATTQPLCLNGTVWDAEADACVPLEPSPTPPGETVTPTPPDDTTDPEPSPTEAEDEDTSDVAEDGDSAPTTEVAGEDRSDPRHSIGLYTYACPLGTNLLTVPAFTAVQTCIQGMPAPTYALTIDGVSQGSKSPGFGEQGHGVVWTGIPGGLVRVVVSTPSTYSLPMLVDCSIGSESSEQVVRFRDEAGLFGLPDFGFYLDVNETAICYVYFVEKPKSAVNLEVLQCPDGMNIYAASPQTLDATCTTPVSDVEFILNASSGAYHATSRFIGATFYPLPAGTGVVTMVPPAGIGLPNVYCETTGPSGQTLSTRDWVYVSIEAQFEITIPTDDAYVSCQVFIVEGGIPVEVAARDPRISRERMRTGD